MSAPAGDSAFLHELELNVRTQLTLAQTSQPEEQADGEPINERLLDPDDQRYETGLRTLLGAVKALEDGSHPGSHPPPAQVPQSAGTAGTCPTGPGRGTETEGS
jgi:hypothetical protein